MRAAFTLPLIRILFMQFTGNRLKSKWHSDVQNGKITPKSSTGQSHVLDERAFFSSTRNAINSSTLRVPSPFASVLTRLDTTNQSVGWAVHDGCRYNLFSFAIGNWPLMSRCSRSSTLLFLTSDKDTTPLHVVHR